MLTLVASEPRQPEKVSLPARLTQSLEAAAMLSAAESSQVYDTVKAYKSDARQYISYCNQKHLALAEGLSSWTAEQLAAGLSASSINRKLSAVKSCIRRATNMHPFSMQAQIEAALRLAKPLRQVRTGVRPEKVLSAEEVGRLLARMSLRGQGFVRFLFATGCRVSEMTGIHLVDCKGDGAAVAIHVAGKGGKHRTVRISVRLFAELTETYQGAIWLFETGAGTQYRREYVSNMIERVSVRAIGRRVSAHSLRHSAATALLESTGKMQAVSEYLGHADPSTTLRFYAHQALSDQELRVLETKREAEQGSGVRAN